MASRSKLTRIEKRKRLDALFDKGAYVYFTADESGTPVIRTKPEDAQPDDYKIWVRPCSPLQREMAVREAQAARARITVASRDENSNEWVTIKGFIAGLTPSALIDYTIDLDETERLSEARRDVLKEPEWEDFNSLRDAMRQYEEAGAPSDAPEWASLLKRDSEFGAQVDRAASELRASAREAMGFMPRADLEKKAFEKRIEQAGTAAFMDAYEVWMTFYACRDEDDHNELYFEDINELRSRPQELQDALGARLALFVTEAGEAKNSQGAAPSSASSEPPAEPEISESSIPVASNA